VGRCAGRGEMAVECTMRKREAGGALHCLAAGRGTRERESSEEEGVESGGGWSGGSGTDKDHIFNAIYI